MRHTRQIRHNHLATNIPADTEAQTGREFFEFLGVQQLTQIYCLVLRVRHLDSHSRLAGDRRFDTDIRRRKVQLDIIRQ